MGPIPLPREHEINEDLCVSSILSSRLLDMIDQPGGHENNFMTPDRLFYSIREIFVNP